MKKGWEIKKLSEICEIFNGGTPDTTVPKFWDGENLWITPKDMGKLESIYVDETFRKITDEGLKNSSAKILPPNSIILSSRAPIGHLAINTKTISTNQGCKGLVPKKGVDTLFLYYFLSKSVDLLNNLGTGATFKELSGSKLGTVEILLPPLSEQQRIVSILDEAFAAIAKAKANAEQNLKNAKELFESYLQGVFENKGDGWEETYLSKVCDFENGDRGKNYPNKSHRVSSGIPFINAGHLNENRLDFSDMDYISEERFNILGNGKIKPNDILFCLRGSLGKVANVGNLNKGAIASSLVILRVKNELDNDFLLYFLNSNLTKKQIVDFGNGAAQPNLSAASLKKFIIPFPKSKEEQQTIVRQLDALRAETQKLESNYQQKINNLEELRKSILQEAFNGELNTEKNLLRYESSSSNNKS